MRHKVNQSKFVMMASIFACFILSSCITSLWSSKDKNKGESDSESENANHGTQISSVDQKVSDKHRYKSKSSGQLESSEETKEIELKQARIWNRLDELEEQVRVQREQIKLLEQGLLTGIPPEALRRAGKSKSTSGTVSKVGPRSAAHEDGGLAAPILDLPEKVSTTSEDNSASSPDSYRVRIQVAKDYYQGSRFGLAVAELSQIMKAFGAKAGEGEAQYYLGRSYLGLKEYLTARTELETFLRDFPNSEFRGLARLDLARSYVGLNLRERARKELSQVAKDFEGQEEGDMAANELRGMKGSI